jgi:hypothetical protein
MPVGPARDERNFRARFLDLAFAEKRLACCQCRLNAFRFNRFTHSNQGNAFRPTPRPLGGGANALLNQIDVVRNVAHA